MDEKQFYGYKHYTLEKSSRCFYVGKGKEGRACVNLHRNHKWYAIVKRLGLRVEVCIGPISEEKAFQWETFNIVEEDTYTKNHHHNDDMDIGCNFTYGGEGSSGLIHTEKTRKLMSEKQKILQNLPERKEKKRQQSLGKKRPDEWVKNIRTSLNQPITKQKRSIASKKAWTHERKQQHSAAVSGTNCKRHRSVNCYSKTHEYITTYQFIADAELKIGISHGRISDCCRGKRHYAGMYVWRYTSDCDPQTHIPYDGHFTHKKHYICSLCKQNGHKKTNCPSFNK